MSEPSIDYNKYCKIAFGSYCQVSQDNLPMNTPKPRTIGAIYLSPTDNIQGGHKVFNLATAKVITQAHATEIPITNDVVQRIEFLAKKDDI